MDNTKFTYTTLDNGLRIVHTMRPGLTEYCGVTIKAGSRNDGQESTHGLAHFVEHTIFKGTARRKSWHIINRMEAVGGELNAYTSEETTVVYSVFPSGNLDRASELLADLVFNSTFPVHQLDRERDVILDEIDSYLDSPSESIFDDFNELIFSGSSLGHNILGTTQSVENICSDDCRSFIDRLYTPANMVFFYQGPTPATKVFRTISRRFGTTTKNATPPLTIAPPAVESFDMTRHGSTHQAHTVMGTRICSMFSPERPAMLLLNNIIGGPGMNSLFNVSLRERHGYVYTVDSAMSLFSDCGLFTIYFGCDPALTGKCRRLVAETIENLADKPMTVKALDAAKKQFIGQLIVATDNFEQTAIGAGRATLFHGKVTPAAETRDSILAVTPDQLRDAAANLLPLSTLTIRP